MFLYEDESISPWTFTTLITHSDSSHNFRPISVLKRATYNGAATVDNLIYTGVKKPILDHYELHDSCLDALNEQINEELYASMVYMNMVC